MADKKATGTVFVAGAGISGIKAAIEPAEAGCKVDYGAGLCSVEEPPLSIFREREFSEVNGGKD